MSSVSGEGVNFMFLVTISTLVYLRRPKCHVLVMNVELAGLSTLLYFILSYFHFII